MNTPLYLGCDPEVFLQDAAGSLVSAIGKIGGTKKQPRPLPIGDGFAVQEDNVALEFNIPPAASRSEFVASVAKARKYLEEQVAGSLGLAFSKASACMFPEDQLFDPAAMVFGCDPDFNAWTMRRNPRPEAPDWTLRSCGGHVHVGYDFSSVSNKINCIKHMDLFLGVPSVLMDDGLLRKQLYGGPGAFRNKPYGLEYRSLSNYWIFKDELVDWVWRQTERAVYASDTKTINMDEHGSNIQRCIGENNMDMAMAMVDHFGLEVVKTL